jgi:acyl-CoA synthetase (AMP-forming)/AMP-acid ligase II
MTNLAELFRRAVTRWPTQPAVTWRGRSFTWPELYARAALVRERLRAAGVGRGDVVAVYAEHSPAQIVAILGIAMAEGVFTLINPLLKENQLKHQLADAEATALIGTRSFLRALEEFCVDRQMRTEAITPEGLLEGIAAADVPAADLDRPLAASIPADVSNIIYTSGSTGLAKGVVIPHRTLLDGARIVSGYLGITERDTILSLLPFTFDYGFNQLLTAAYTGARIVLHEFTFPNDLVQTLVEERVTGMAGVPSLWPHLFNPRLLNPATKPDFPHLRYVTTAGGFHSQELLRSLSAFSRRPRSS